MVIKRATVLDRSHKDRQVLVTYNDGYKILNSKNDYQRNYLLVSFSDIRENNKKCMKIIITYFIYIYSYVFKLYIHTFRVCMVGSFQSKANSKFSYVGYDQKNFCKQRFISIINKSVFFIYDKVIVFMHASAHALGQV